MKFPVLDGDFNHAVGKRFIMTLQGTKFKNAQPMSLFGLFASKQQHSLIVVLHHTFGYRHMAVLVF
jgi:hypothetical protein